MTKSSRVGTAARIQQWHNIDRCAPEIHVKALKLPAHAAPRLVHVRAVRKLAGAVLQELQHLWEQQIQIFAGHLGEIGVVKARSVHQHTTIGHVQQDCCTRSVAAAPGLETDVANSLHSMRTMQYRWLRSAPAQQQL